MYFLTKWDDDKCYWLSEDEMQGTECKKAKLRSLKIVKVKSCKEESKSSHKRCQPKKKRI